MVLREETSHTQWMNGCLEASKFDREMVLFFFENPKPKLAFDGWLETCSLWRRTDILYPSTSRYNTYLGSCVLKSHVWYFFLFSFFPLWVNPVLRKKSGRIENPTQKISRSNVNIFIWRWLTPYAILHRDRTNERTILIKRPYNNNILILCHHKVVCIQILSSSLKNHGSHFQ